MYQSNQKRLIKFLVLLVVVSLGIYYQFIKTTKLSSMKELKVFVPFVFSKELDPRAVHTVGDQLLSEHIFAFHYSASDEKTILPLFSNVNIDYKKKIVNLDLRKDIIDSSGNNLSSTQICKAITSSFSGTQHTKYLSLVKSIECENSSAKIYMSEIPVNLEYWLRSTDFAICDLEKLPISQSKIVSTTGPYFVKSLEPGYVELNSNQYFPKEFRSNDIQKVIFQSYSPGKVEELTFKKDLDLAYLYGYSIEESFLESFRDRDFKIQIFPNEWLVYIGFNDKVSLEERKLIANYVDDLKSSMTQYIEMGNLAYSTTPSDRAYSLAENEYSISKTASKLTELKKELSISTLDEWINIPLFKFLLGKLQKRFSIKLNVFSRSEMHKIYSQESDLYLSPMGISAADPLGNYSFLKSFNKLFGEILTDEFLTESYKESNFSKFTNKIKEIERKIIQDRALVPIGHFPGIVLESSRLSRDSSKAWDWGIQAWTYKVN